MSYFVVMLVIAGALPGNDICVTKLIEYEKEHYDWRVTVVQCNNIFAGEDRR